jgi:hypothetical protein
MAKSRISGGGDTTLAQTGYIESNEAAGFSAFGGHVLGSREGASTAVAVADDQLMRLASLGIEDAEQLLAIAAIPQVREELQNALGTDANALQRLLDDANGMLPPDRATLVSSPAPRDLGLGVLLPTAEMIAAAESSAASPYAAEALVALPTSVNLIAFLSPIRNQAARGTCVSFTLTALNEYILRRRGISQNLSEQHLYYETKRIDGASSQCGTWQAKAVIVLSGKGECRETVWPYNPNPPCNNHGALPTQARPDALQFRLPTLTVAPRNVAEYKTHMSRQRPVTLSIPVYNSWYQSAETRRSGRITMRVGNEPAAGGHAVCLVGYQDSASSPGGGYFIVRNSWDTPWAYQSPYGGGYGTIPYQYIANEAWEAFTAVVPGVGADDDVNEDTSTAEQSTVTIEVSPNIKITITGAKSV